MDAYGFYVLVTVVWVGSLLVVAVDSAMRGTSPIFWRLAALFGGPLVLMAYSIVREQSEEEGA